MDASPRIWSARGAAVLDRLRRLSANPWLRMAFIILSLGFLAAVLRAYSADIRAFRLQLSWNWLGVSILGLFPCMLLEVALWRRLLLELGHELPLRRAAGVWFLSNLARYVPGRIWQFVGMMELGADSGVPRGAILASVAAHQVLTNATGVLIGVPALVSALGASRATWLTGVAVGLAVVAFGLSPWTLTRLSRVLTPIARPPSGQVRLSQAPLALILLGYCLYWVGLGTAFWSLGRALGANSGDLIGWASAFPASYVAGYLSLLTPSGVGVREGVLALLLAPVAGAGVAGVAALAARLWLTVAELLAAAVALGTNRSLVWSPRNRGPA